MKPPSLPPFNNPVPEQTFLAKHYDENAKKPDRDPRGAFRNPNESSAAGIVGPMGSSSFNLPNVERALTEMEGSVNGSPASNVGGDNARKLSSRPTGRPPTSSLAVPATNVPGGRGPSPTLSSAASPSPTNGQTQHEVLQNFFQSLLSSKDRVGGNTSTKSSPSKPPAAASPSNTDGGTS